jgi:hypothetical protein
VKGIAMNRFSSSLIAILLLTPAVSADTLKKSRVPVGARWLAHLDVEALKSSKLFHVVHQESAKNGGNEMDEGLSEFKAFAGLDPTMDFKSVTIYCTATSEKSCVALLAGNAKIDDALVKLKAMPNYRTTPAQSYLLHTWGDEHDTWYAYVHHKDGAEERVVIASQDTTELVRGISLLEHGGESLAEASRPAITAAPAPGSILFAAAGESLLELSDAPPVSAVAKLAKTIVLDVGEDRGELRLHVALETRTQEDAQRIQQVLQGAVALVGLVHDDEHEEARSKVQNIVEALHLSVSNARVDADFRYDVQTLIDDLKSLHEHGSNGDGSDKASKSERKHHARKHQEQKQDEDR